VRGDTPHGGNLLSLASVCLSHRHYEVLLHVPFGVWRSAPPKTVDDPMKTSVVWHSHDGVFGSELWQRYLSSA